MRTLRFLLIARAGRLARIDGRQVLRLTEWKFSLSMRHFFSPILG
jgi:hypothetical protein